MHRVPTQLTLSTSTLAVLALATATATPALAVTRTWTNGTGNGDWTDTGNWSGGNPPAATGFVDNALFGNLTGVQQDVAQNITLNSNVELTTTNNLSAAIDINSSGGENYNLGGSGMVLIKSNTGGDDNTVRLQGSDDAIIGLAIRLQTQNSGAPGLTFKSQGTGVLHLAGNIDYDPSISSPLSRRFLFRGTTTPATPGRIKLSGTNNFSGTSGALIWDNTELMIGSTAAFGSGATLSDLAIGAVTASDTESILSLTGSNGQVKSLKFIDLSTGTSDITVRIDEAGSTDRVFTIGQRLFVDAGGHDNALKFGSNPSGGTGKLTVRFTAAAQTHSARIETLSSTDTVEISADNPTFQRAISGLGRMLINSPTSSATTTFTAAQTYSGGTVIQNGRVQITGAGRMPDTGTVFLNPGTRISFNAISDTVGGFAGEGNVRVGTAADASSTVTVDQVLSPGLTTGDTGTLDVGAFSAPSTHTAGTLALGSSSVSTFDVNFTTGLADQVNYLSSNGNIQLGGTLDIVGHGTPVVGSWVLFQLADGGTGSLSGSFSTTNLLPGVEDQVVQIGNDLVYQVTAVPEPGSALAIGLLGLSVLGLRRRAR